MRETLHFLGYDEDRGGVLTAIRTLAAEGGARHVLVVNPGFRQRRQPSLAERVGPAVRAEEISAANLWPTFRAAMALLPATLSGEAVVHGQSRAGTLVGLWLWLLGGRAVVVSPHCFGRQRWFYRWAATCLGERWAWLSPAMKCHYDAGGAATWAGCIPEPAPVFRGRARPGAGRRRPLTLLGSGTLVAWKGWHVVLEALAQLAPEERRQLRFVHIGDTDGTRESAEYAAALRAQADALGVAAQVEWRGWQPDAGAALAASDVAIVPSTNEPMALAGLEALAAGVPLIIADSGGLNDIVTPGRNALVFRTGDPASLTACLRDLVSGDFLARVDIGARDFGRISAIRVAAQWRQRYTAVSGGADHVV